MNLFWTKFQYTLPTSLKFSSNYLFLFQFMFTVVLLMCLRYSLTLFMSPPLSDRLSGGRPGLLFSITSFIAPISFIFPYSPLVVQLPFIFYAYLISIIFYFAEHIFHDVSAMPNPIPGTVWQMCIVFETLLSFWQISQCF